MCGKMSSKTTYFADIWFSGLKTADNVIANVEDYCGPEDTSNKVFA